MELTPMQYKSYVWPHNPRTYRITYQRQVAVQKVPFGRYALQNLGMTRRVMEGEGEFFGPDAYDEFRKLASVFYQEGPGVLIHPVWQSARVYFVALALAQEPKQDYVRYTFAFWENDNRCSQSLTPVGQKQAAVTAPKPGNAAPAGNIGTVSGAVYHTVTQGETLWGIAQSRGMTLGQLLVLNPQLKNPNRVSVGERLRVQ